MAYELIETIEVGAGGAASIEFTSIPQDGVDLLLLVSARAASGTVNRANLSLNGSASGFSSIYLIGYGTVQSGSSTNDLIEVNRSDHTSNTFSNARIYFSNYTSSSAKSISTDGVTENNAATAFQKLNAASWSGTSAISSLSMQISGANFAQYSTASLYKIS